MLTQEDKEYITACLNKRIGVMEDLAKYGNQSIITPERLAEEKLKTDDVIKKLNN